MFSKGDNVRDFLFAYVKDEVFPKKRSILKVKNSLRGDLQQILYFMRLPHFIWEATMTMKELLPLKV